MVTGIFFFPPLTKVETNLLTFSHFSLLTFSHLTIHIYFLHLTILMLLPHQNNTFLLELLLTPLHPPLNPPLEKVEPNLLTKIHFLRLAQPFLKVEIKVDLTLTLTLLTLLLALFILLYCIYYFYFLAFQFFFRGTQVPL